MERRLGSSKSKTEATCRDFAATYICRFFTTHHHHTPRIMGTRKRARSPRTPGRFSRFQQRQYGNSGGSTAIRSPRSPHTPTRKKPNHKPVPDTVQIAKIQGAREWAIAMGIPHDSQDILTEKKRYTWYAAQKWLSSILIVSAELAGAPGKDPENHGSLGNLV